MTTDDIAKLIEACKNAGVSKFKFEKLEIHFQGNPRLVTAPTSPSPIDQAIERDIEEDPDLQAIAMNNLLCEDPLAYEQARRKSGGAFGQ